MAKKALFPLEDPPTASSSDEDDDVISISEEDEPEVTPNPRSDVAAPSSGKKRRREGTTSVIAKRTKSAKRFTWSEDDEITLLQRMIDFNADTGTNPFEVKNGFFDFVEKDISFDVSQTQVVYKIRNLKRKFIWEKRAQPSSLSKDHDKECLRLAQFVWRPNGTLLLTSKKANDGKEVFSRSGGDKALEEGDREVFSRSGRDKAVEEGVKEVFSHRGEGSGKRLVEEDEVLAHVGEAAGKMAIEEEDEEEVLARSQGGGDPEWFERTVFVQSVASFGLAEHSIRERWSSFSAETKKKLKHEWKSLESKKLHVASLKTRFMSKLASMFAQAI